jgi:hypothetical protein
VPRQIKRRLKKTLGQELSRKLTLLSKGQEIVRWGNLRRTKPFCDVFGRSRGLPIGRYYLHQFLERHREKVTGDVLEIHKKIYTFEFGSNLRKTDTVDIETVYEPTFLCDLAESEYVIPSDAYDAFLLPFSPQHFVNLDACLRNILRVVRPGGWVLMTNVGLTPLTEELRDFWRISAGGWKIVCDRVWQGTYVEIQSYGNALAATAAMMGICVEELSPAELDVSDPRYPVMVSIAAQKS